MQLSSAENNNSAGLVAGKIVVVTGGAGLLGQAFCRAIVEHGGLPVIADIDGGRGEKALAVLQKIPEYRGGAFVQMNIGDLVSVRVGLQSVHKQFGRIDAVVNNAYPRNARYGKKFEDVTYADFCENVSLHAGGYFLVAQQAATIFRDQRHGNIINMGSVYGTLAPRFEIYGQTSMTMPVEYAVIKAGVLQLTRYLAKYLGKDGIRVNAISPGGISDNQPGSFLESYRKFCGEKGMLDANDVCGALLFLLSDFSKYMNGQNLLIDDGFSL